MGNALHDEIAAAVGETPCRSVDELFAAPARRIIARLLRDFLAKSKVTATELLHRSDMLDRLESGGTLFQFVVQQVAIVRASQEKRPVQQIIRELNSLGSSLVDQVHTDRRNNKFIELRAEDFGAYASKIAEKPNAMYLLNGALARHLRDARHWTEKSVRLVRLLELAQPDEPGQEILTSAVDAIFAELFLVPAAVLELLEPQESFGHTITALVHLFLGKGDSPLYAKSSVLPALAAHISGGLLPQTRASIAAQIVTQIYSLQPLGNDTPDNELRAFKRLRELLAGAYDETLRAEEVEAALEIRAKRFVDAKTISAGLGTCVLPEDKINWLLFVEDCIVGVRNKQVLAENATRIATADSFKAQFQLSSIPLPKRLQKLAALSIAVHRSGLHKNDRKALSSAFDAVAFGLAKDAKLFEIMEARPASPAEKAIALLQLHDAHTFTEGRLSEKVRDTVIGYLGSPGFLDGYVGRFSGSAERAIAELTQKVQKIGLSPEDLRDLIAA